MFDTEQKTRFVMKLICVNLSLIKGNILYTISATVD
jgi:hypothetical protein